MTLIFNSIVWAIILPFYRATITDEVVSKVVSDIIGSCCMLISLLCEVFKGIIKYFGPIIHVSMDFIIWQHNDGEGQEQVVADTQDTQICDEVEDSQSSAGNSSQSSSNRVTTPPPLTPCRRPTPHRRM